MMTSASVLLPSTAHRDLATRLFGSMWFLFLAAFVGCGAIGDLRTAEWSQTSSRLGLSIFYLLLWWMILSRPPATSQASGSLPRLAAFVGTYMPWCITFTARSEQLVPNILSTILVLVGTLLMVITILNLGKSFSLVPETRRMVSTGPYRYIRHPLYLTEEIALAGVVLQVASLSAVLIFVAHMGVQVCRIMYEEKLLRRTLPGYGRYAASTWRLIPFVW